MFNLEINDDICAIREREVNETTVFNHFWLNNTNIMYVVDDEDKFVGVITNRGFFAQMEEESKAIDINRSSSVITDDGKGDILYKAKELFTKYNITTAVPVLNEEGKILFEIRKKREKLNRRIVDRFKYRLRSYERSVYLKDELSLLRNMLNNQRILVLGSEETFDEIIGDLFISKRNITFAEFPDKPYEFMRHNQALLIDVSDGDNLGRNEIYNYTCGGYGIKEFMDIVMYIIENEICSRFYAVVRGDIVTIRDYFEGYGVTRINFSEIGVIAAEFKDYLRNVGIDVNENTGIMRKISYLMDINGTHFEGRETEYELIGNINIILQYYTANQLLQRYQHIPVLNFVFDTELEATDYEKKILEGKYCNRKNVEMERFYSISKTEKQTVKNILGDIRVSDRRNFENDLIILEDCRKEWYNVENGMRRTVNQPEEYYGTVYFLGACTIYGHKVGDSYTIPSLIQNYVNESGKKYRMINLGKGHYSNCANLIESLNICDGDIFVILFPYITKGVKELIEVKEVGDSFNRIRAQRYNGMDCFYDGSVQHCADNGNVIYAQIIYDELKEYLDISGNRQLRKDSIYNVFRKNERDLNNIYDYNDYMAELDDKRFAIHSDENVKIGCVVVNCNPFTYGHKYLIEYARKHMDYLYIFVVEEDGSSYFTFHDRFEMVRRGVEDLDNVLVLGSGKMVASLTTFPSYFNRGDAWMDIEDDTNTDVRVFAQYIAPKLDIKYRFVGEEKEDEVTASYNISLKKILPIYGMELVEIPRKKEGGRVISASEVRKCYQNHHFDRLRELVPETTFEYLKGLSESSKYLEEAK